MSNLPFPSNVEYLTVKETAALFRVCTKSVHRWIAATKLPATRLGRDWRIARSDLKSFVAHRSNTVIGRVL